jgi:outer membrane protein TolC
LELVTDAYSRGAVAIVTLLDAQNSALVAYEGAANAVYGFLIDLMGVERAIGQFYFLRTEQEKQTFFNRLEEFYRKAGVRL